MKRTRIAVTLALVAALALPASALAAEVVNETVVVPSVVGITLSKHAINYGTVIPGADQTQAEAAATEAERSITYTITSNASWTLTVTGSSFTGTPSGTMSDNARTAKIGAGSYGPTGNLSDGDVAGTFPTTAVFLVRPPSGQAPASYAGTITFSVTAP